MLASELRDKLQVRFRLSPAQLVIEVNHRNHNPDLTPQFQQQPQQRHRINPAGHGHADTIPGPQQFLPPDVAQNAFREFMHGNMVQPSAHAPETPASAAREVNAGSSDPQQ
jgi:hypothetical protein